MKRLFIAVLMIFSITTAFAQIVNKAEYFFDNDPGPGNGSPITISTPGVSVSFPAQIPINLSPGFHWLGIRVKDSDGKWSLFQRKDFYVSQPSFDLPIVTKAEYFFDNDPGVGSGTPLTFQTSGFSVSQTFPITVPASMTAGTHYLAIRVKDQAGHWSLFQRDTIVVGAAAGTITCPGNVVVSAAAGQCSAVVNNIDAVTSPAGTSYTYTMSGATTGTGTGTVSGKIFNAGVTTVTYALSSAPSINCSFTVTVNANVVPSVSISQSPTIICSGSVVTFTANPVNGGSTPAYQWKVNDINVGNNSNTYTPPAPVNGNIVKVIMTSSLGCASPPSATSNSITMMVDDSVQEYVSITASATTICAGTLVTFSAAESGGGSGTFQWKLNGNNVGTNSLIYRTDSLHNGDKVKVVFATTFPCSPPLVSSNEITITVNSASTPSVSILASANNICPGRQVTFTATPVNGGTTPSYQWKLNGNNVGSNSSTYQNSSLQNGDSIRVVMTSSLASVCQPTVSSNKIIMSVNQQVIPSVSIISSATTICPGQSVTFTATATNGGTQPIYQWVKNGSLADLGSVYQTSSLANGDSVWVILYNTTDCIPDYDIISNVIHITVSQTVTPSVSISSTATTICPGQSVTFTATPTNGGNNPVYEWMINNNAVGTNSNIFQTSSLQNGAVVKVSMVSSLGCAIPQQAISNSLTMTVGSNVTPSVSINASAIDICAGNSVTFTATPANGGSTPSYQWKLNGNNVGTNSPTYQSSSLNNADTIRVVMTTSLSCASSNSATSNYISMDVTQPVSPSVSIVASSASICSGQSVSFTATPTNGGASPVYQWNLNGAIVGTNSNTFQSSALSNNDVVSVSMTSSLPCVTASVVNSNSISIAVSQQITYYADKDGDGYGDAADSVVACGLRAGFVTNKSDCNDNNASVNPGATEICGNGIDDNCNGQTDENCTDTIPTLLIKTYPVKEGDAGFTIVNVEVKLDMPAMQQVSVNYATSNANATAGYDYVAADGVLTIPVGAISGTVQLKVIGDLLREDNESFWLVFSNPVNVLLGSDPKARIMIIDDDKGKPTSASPNKEAITEATPFKIPTVAKRNAVWFIPQIGTYENEVMILNVQGQVVSRFINYKNQTPIGNVASGLYFYRIQIKESSGQFKFYTGRLLITE